ncbi:MAG: HigA family addiction module antitoxin [Bacteroidales bacterium]|nr:HigA family addiction module antitoxin [Bacteroidales bacterium]
MTQTNKPFIAVHPGELVKDKIEARGVSQKKLAEILGVPYTMLNEILNGKRPVTTETALLLEAALDINAEMLVNMQSSYSLQTARKNKTLTDRFTSVRQACAAMLL